MDKSDHSIVVRFGRQVSRTRREQGLTQQALADRLGMTSKSISFIERGENLPSSENIFRIASILNMSLDEVVFGSPNLNGEILTQDVSDAFQSLSREDREALVTMILLFSERLRAKADPHGGANEDET